MKKTLFIFIVLVCVVATAFAQIPENLNIQKIEEEGTTDRGFPYTMTIEYLPATGEAFFTFSINMDLFDKNEAMLAIRDRVEKFMGESKENDERKYYAYAFRGADTTKFDTPKRMAHYTSRVQFSEIYE